jgi:septal ring factor EnvC (AmiA/AmiB activator)
MSSDNDKSSNWGGARPGSGNKYKWRHGETKAVRIPIAVADKVLEVAKAIDSGEFEPQPESVTQSCRDYQVKIEELKTSLASVTKQLEQVTEERNQLRNDSVTQSSQLHVTQSTLNDCRDRFLLGHTPGKRRELKKVLDLFLRRLRVQLKVLDDVD